MKRTISTLILISSAIITAVAHPAALIARSSDRESVIALLFVALLIIVGLVITIGSYVLVAYMAKRRGREAALWVLVAILASPVLAIIILLVIGDAENKYNPKDEGRYMKND